MQGDLRLMMAAATEIDRPALPAAFAKWFAARNWQPHPHQLEMIRAAKDGADALLIAPTGGGKTLAGFLPSLMDIAENGAAGLHTLYVSPLKALAVDVERNLTIPVAEMGLPIRIETRTGDTPQHKRQRQRFDPPDMLLTTPESLALLLSYPDSHRYFCHLRTVIVDEIHAMADNKRGDQMAVCLSRLNALAPGCRRVGLSATVAWPEASQRGWHRAPILTKSGASRRRRCQGACLHTDDKGGDALVRAFRCSCTGRSLRRDQKSTDNHRIRQYARIVKLFSKNYGV